MFSPVLLLPTYPWTPVTQTALPLSKVIANLPGVNGIHEDMKTKDLASGKTNQQPICVIKTKVEFSVILTTKKYVF